MMELHSIQEIYGENSAWYKNTLPEMAKIYSITGLADYDEEFAIIKGKK